LGGHRGPYNLELPDWFWTVLDQIRADPEQAEVLLRGLSSLQIQQFYYAYREATDELYGDYGDDARGWSDDDVYNASCWVLNQGKEFYIAVWNDLTLYPDPEHVEACDYSGLAAHVAWERDRKELYG
jgi:hypothetical protein